MLSLTIAGGIFLLDYKIKEHIDSTRLQGSKEEVLGGRLLLRNCHNKDKILGKVKIGRENCQELAAAGMGCVAGVVECPTTQTVEIKDMLQIM